MDPSRESRVLQRVMNIRDGIEVLELELNDIRRLVGRMIELDEREAIFEHFWLIRKRLRRFRELVELAKELLDHLDVEGTKMYHVVEFDGDGGVGIVREEWLTPRKKETFWPPFKISSQYNKCLVDGTKPENTWVLCKITRKFYVTDDIQKARQKAKEAEDESDVRTDYEEGIVKRKRKQKKVFSESSDDENSPTKENLKKIRQSVPVLPETFSVTPITVTSFDEVPVEEEHVENAPFSPFLLHNEEQDLPLASAGFEVVARRLAKCESMLEEILENQRKIINVVFAGEEVSNAEVELNGVHLPCERIEDVEKLECWLQSPENFQLLEKNLLYKGGKTLREVSYRILGKIFSNSVGKNYNWTGKSGKQSLKKLTKTVAVIQCTIRRNFASSGATDSEIETVVRNWFRYVKDRDGGREHRRNLQQF
ncbi:uncharacterized protein LOC129233476 [Uloborus diversus]|uniref:uncharacterized protein LOC129233476 n=1 Tax=Uloborus diversus TaxID=327109 RepID=UPI002409E4F4|nr:uncharacterized protein LOC129233476 [Uloborus diversus]